MVVYLVYITAALGVTLVVLFVYLALQLHLLSKEIKYLFREIESNLGRFFPTWFEEEWPHPFHFGWRHAWRVDMFIREQEVEFGIRLTPGARQMLLIPLTELGPKLIEIEWEQVRSSLSALLSSMKEDPAPSEEELFRERRSSLSVIRAFWRKYCNIPPFCQKTDKEYRR